MFGLNRKNRPVELGPYPLEKLRRDADLIAKECARAPELQTIKYRDDTQLAAATIKHLHAYEELRKPEPFYKKAPVPDDSSIRTGDIKGSGYFLDASQIGICILSDSARITNATENHRHAVVVLVEYGNEIDTGNPAADWVAGNEQLLATLRAAEIALCLAGQIASMGFATRAHWSAATDVDLDKLAVLAGLASRAKGSLRNPYLDNRFAIAAVTTNYELDVDLPLHRSTGNAGNLPYYFGLSGAVSGLERWRRRRRPSHLGPFPVESLKRVDKPTTHIFDDEVPRVPSRANFYVRTALGDLSSKALKEAARWSQKHPVSQGVVGPNWAVKPLQAGQAAPRIHPGTDNAADNARALKALSYYLGSSVTGICGIPDYCWYSHDKRGNSIEPYHQNALVVLIDQGYETFLGASGNDWISGSQSMRAYLRGAEVVSVMADMVRRMGYPARAHSNLDSHELHVPLVLHVGLGEQSRIGESALNPFLGMRFKTAVLTTDMPLEADKPIDFGVQTFCSMCNKCARECPCQAIPYGDKVIFNGYETWKPDSERCTPYRATNMKGSACGRCVKTCPLSKDTTWDGPLSHRFGSWLGINVLWLKPVIAPIAIWLDDVLGNGNPIDAKRWWLDLEVIGEKSFRYNPGNHVVKAMGANRPKIDPRKKINPDINIAYYPASTLPPPDAMGPCPADRKAGLEFAVKPETVAAALKRRARGGAMPEMYISSYTKDGTTD